MPPQLTVQVNARWDLRSPIRIGRICKGYKFLHITLGPLHLKIKLATAAGEQRHRDFMRHFSETARKAREASR